MALVESFARLLLCLDRKWDEVESLAIPSQCVRCVASPFQVLIIRWKLRWKLFHGNNAPDRLQSAFDSFHSRCLVHKKKSGLNKFELETFKMSSWLGHKSLCFRQNCIQVRKTTCSIFLSCSAWKLWESLWHNIGFQMASTCVEARSPWKPCLLAAHFLVAWLESLLRFLLQCWNLLPREHQLMRWNCCVGQYSLCTDTLRHWASDSFGLHASRQRNVCNNANSSHFLGIQPATVCWTKKQWVTTDLALGRLQRSQCICSSKEMEAFQNSNRSCICSGTFSSFPASNLRFWVTVGCCHPVSDGWCVRFIFSGCSWLINLHEELFTYWTPTAACMHVCCARISNACHFRPEHGQASQHGKMRTLLEEHPGRSFCTHGDVWSLTN